MRHSFLSISKIINRLTKRGYSPGFLATERAKIKACDDANKIQEAAEGGTAGQKKALAELNDWLHRILGHANRDWRLSSISINR